MSEPTEQDYSDFEAFYQNIEPAISIERLWDDSELHGTYIEQRVHQAWLAWWGIILRRVDRAVDDMKWKFTSGNHIAVTRASITDIEWGSLYHERKSLQARVAELEAICENVPEGCTPADARVLREANHALVDEVARATWHKDIAEDALLSVEKERDKWQEIANRWLAVSNDQTLACSYLREERDGLAAKCAELERQAQAIEDSEACAGAALMLVHDRFMRGVLTKEIMIEAVNSAGTRSIAKLKADAVREWLDDVIAMLVNSHEMTTHRGMTHVAVDHLREHLPQYEANQIERDAGCEQWENNND